MFWPVILHLALTAGTRCEKFQQVLSCSFWLLNEKSKIGGKAECLQTPWIRELSDVIIDYFLWCRTKLEVTINQLTNQWKSMRISQVTRSTPSQIKRTVFQFFLDFMGKITLKAYLVLSCLYKHTRLSITK